MRPQPASDRFHLLSVCSSRAYGGLERFQLEIARSMAERGHAVTVVARPGSRFGEAALEADFPVLPLRFGSYLAPLTTVRLSRIMRRTGVHVVHYRLSRDIWTVAPAARLAGLRGKVVHKPGRAAG